jgi:hypothetical protein
MKMSAQTVNVFGADITEAIFIYRDMSAGL